MTGESIADAITWLVDVLWRGRATMKHDLRDRARSAVARQDWPDAASLWRELALVEPDSLEAAIGASGALRACRRFDEADLVLTAIAARFPGMFDLGLEAAWIAHYRWAQSIGPWLEVERRWQRLRDDHPANPTGHLCCAMSFRAAGRSSAASEILRELTDRFPDHFDAAVEYAWTSHLAGDWPQTHAGWLAVRTRFPRRIEGYAFGISSLIESGDCLGARALLDEGRARFAGSAELAIQAALVEMKERDFAAALRAGNVIQEHFPDRPEGHRIAAQALRELGDAAAAKSLAETGLRRFPVDLALRIEAARAAERARDWSDAGDRWQGILADHPRHEEALLALGDIALQRQLDAVDAGVDPVARETSVTMKTDTTDLMLRFESLGDNCEFGFIQRRHGAEPLGLLRWAGIDTQALLTGLRSGFAGIDEPGKTWLTIDEHGDYVAHMGGLFTSHTFYKASQVTYERMHGQTLRRAELLRRKFLSSVACASKIFVHKRGQNRTGMSEVRAIAAALRALGPAQLLWVQEAGAAHPPGSAERVDETLITGFVERLPEAPFTSATPHDTWLRLLRRVAEMVDEITPFPRSPAAPASPPAPADAGVPPPA